MANDTIIIRLAEGEVGGEGVLRYQAGAMKLKKWRTGVSHYGRGEIDLPAYVRPASFRNHSTL